MVINLSRPWVELGSFEFNASCDGRKLVVVSNFSYLACSRILLEQKLADADVSEEDQSNLLKFLEKKETEYMRLQRHKMGADDFELLTMIGKGAFGEVNIMGHRCKIHCFSFMAFLLRVW